MLAAIIEKFNVAETTGPFTINLLDALPALAYATLKRPILEPLLVLPPFYQPGSGHAFEWSGENINKLAAVLKVCIIVVDEDRKDNSVDVHTDPREDYPVIFVEHLFQPPNAHHPSGNFANGVNAGHNFRAMTSDRFTHTQYLMFIAKNYALVTEEDKLHITNVEGFRTILVHVQRYLTTFGAKRDTRFGIVEELVTDELKATENATHRLKKVMFGTDTSMLEHVIIDRERAMFAVDTLVTAEGYAFRSALYEELVVLADVMIALDIIVTDNEQLLADKKTFQTNVKARMNTIIDLLLGIKLCGF